MPPNSTPRVSFTKQNSKLYQLEQVRLLGTVMKWLLISLLVAVLAGTASAALLASLEYVTNIRESHLWIVGVLPLAGFLVGWLYLKFGKSVESGNNLLIDEVHDPKKTVPLRMTPLVLFGTIMSHLFGASVGREGTAIQMGASLADQLSLPLRMSADDRRILLMAGISAGFGSVFGVPLAGAVFGLEVLAIGKIRYDALLPCFLASIIANHVTLAFGIHHGDYHIPTIPSLSTSALLSAVVAGIAFGLVGMLFARTTHAIGHGFKKRIRYAPLRPLIGGAVIAIAVWILGTTKYIGLGLPTIAGSFTTHLPPWDFAGKFIFTAFSLGASFKGGEVTPLFFIGSALGNALSPILSLPAPLLAGMGFVAVFAGAANTPISSTIMAMEIFGPQAGIYAGIACVLSYLFSGHAGIYQSQRIGFSKIDGFFDEEGLTLAASSQARKLPEFDLVHDLNIFFNPKGKEGSSMQTQVATLRFYFHQGMKVQARGFWKRLTAPAMGVHLATKAKAFGIEQAIVQSRISAGYLKGDSLTYNTSDIPLPKLPQCVELVDQPEKLKQFLIENMKDLNGVRAILQRCEDPIFDSAVDATDSLFLPDNMPELVMPIESAKEKALIEEVQV